MNLIDLILKRGAKLIDFIQYWACMAIIAFLIVITVVQIFYRFALNNPITWVQEISTGLLIWLTFLGAGVLTNRGQHIRVDILFNRLPVKVKRIIDVLLNLFIFVFAVYLIYFALDLYKLQSVTPMGVLNLPRSIYFALPVLVFSLSVPVYTLEKIFAQLQMLLKKEETQEEQNNRTKETAIWN